LITWWNPEIVDHPLAGRQFGTHIQVGQLNADTFILTDLETGGISLTNNMENALDLLFRNQGVMEYDEQKLNIYQWIENEGLFKIEHEWTKAGTRDIKWVYFAPNLKALEVLF